jgi:flavin reductase (DIM6/NTAB) family NADH-FMN oxidoreductase RutF
LPDPEPSTDPSPDTSSAPSPLALALGRLPTGLYIVSSLLEGRPVGFVGSFVMQAGLQPPAVSVAIAKGREHLRAVRACGAFGVSILDKASQRLMSPFFRKGPGSPFDEVRHRAAPSGVPVLDEALAWLDCRVTGEHATGDHVVVFGEVTAGGRERAGEPSVRLRESGLDY